MIVHVHATADEVSAFAADRVADVVSAKPAAVIGLPTGRTPIGLYAQLRARPIDWTSVTTFDLDELVGLPPDHPKTYRTFLREHLLDPVGLRESQMHFLDGSVADLAGECARYDAVLKGAGGLDLLICGVGANGHIAFNEPAAALHAAPHVQTLLDETRRSNAAWFDGDLSAVPAQALTLGMAALLGARRVLVLATGAAKADIVEAMVRGPLTTGLPASWLQVHPAVDLVLDRAASVRVVP